MKSKRKNSLVIAMFLFCVVSVANCQTWDWAQAAGGSLNDYATGAVNDKDGNLYITGSFNGSATFGGKVVISQGDYDIFLAKYTSNGKLIWISQAGGSESDEAYGIALDLDNNIYITGYFSNHANFGNLKLTGSGDRDCFLAKYDSNGNVNWVKQGGGSGSDFGKSVATDHFGNIIITGIFGGEAFFNSQLIKSKGKNDIFIASYNSAGDLKWVQRAGGSGKDEATSIAVDNEGNAFVTGWFSGLADFGGSQLTSNGDDDIFIAKYSISGSVEWVHQAGGYQGIDRSYSITADLNGNIYLTGSYIGTAIFSAKRITSSADDCFIAKYNSNGNLLWLNTTASKNGEVGRAIALDKEGNIYVAGDYNTTIVSKPEKLSDSDWDIFMVKYDASGKLIGENRAGGEGYNRPIAISIDNNKNCYVIGVFEKRCNFGKIIFSNSGSADIFIARTHTLDPVE